MGIKITTLTEFDIVIDFPVLSALMERKEQSIHKKLNIEEINSLYREFNVIVQDLELFLGKVNFTDKPKRKMKYGKTQNQIINYITGKTVFSLDDVKNGTTLTTAQISNVLTNLISKGLVKRTSLGNYEVLPSKIVEC